MATVITLHVHITKTTMILATNTRRTSAFRATVQGLHHDTLITATTIHALITTIAAPAICTENQWVFQAIAPVSGHLMVTVITLHVHIPYSRVLATSTVRSMVVRAIVPGLRQYTLPTATTIYALISRTSIHAIYTESQSMAQTVVPVSGHPMTTVITLHVPLHINTEISATNTVGTAVGSALAAGLE